MAYEGSWSGMRKYLEEDMLAPCLQGRIRYDCTAYPQANYSSRMFILRVDGETVQRFCMEEVCRWFVETGRIPREKRQPLPERWHTFWQMLPQTPPSARIAYTDDEFCNAMATYRQQDIQTSLHSANPVVTMFALLDRRLGKRSYQAVSMGNQPAWLQKIHQMRGCAEGWMISTESKGNNHMSNIKTVGILGSGTWGVALARLLQRNGHRVTVWSKFPKEVEALDQTRVHPNLPGLTISREIAFTSDIRAACRKKDILLFAVPSVFVRSTAQAAAPYIPEGQIIVDVAKGIEPDTLLTMTEVIRDVLKRPVHLVALSGPTHAEEVALDLPTSIVSACTDLNVAETVQDVFMNSCMRTYTNRDVLGVELCGALKNIIALGAGISTGLGNGDNAKAALITRGMAEITRLGLAMGCAEQTFMGLAGIGDLIVTATSAHSRNNRCGVLIGQGVAPQEAIQQVGMVVEGVNALPAALQLAERYGVDMPIVRGVNAVVQGEMTPAEMAFTLMTRDKTSEVSQQEMHLRFESAWMHLRHPADTRRVLIIGDFAALNCDTVDTLRRARELGSWLAVALLDGPDEQETARRASVLSALRPVDKLIRAHTVEDVKDAIQTLRIDLVALPESCTEQFGELRETGAQVVEV